jgi:hypothetical protein
MPNTQSQIKERYDRPVNKGGQVVEAHGANETQNHDYSEDATPGHITGKYEHKGEAAERIEKSSSATAGRHIVSKKSELQVTKERKAANESARTEHQKSWDSNKLTVVPERKKSNKR